jgi:hypothetical protein
MALIQIPDPQMSNKDLESADLETHVLLCQHRYQAIDERFDRIEASIDSIIEQSKATKRIITGAIVTILTGAAGTAISILINLLKQ